MPIPKTRAELVELVTKTAGKLSGDLDRVDADLANELCTEDWSIKDLLAVRAWWTERVIDWVEAGRRGERPVTPAPGYGWRETPRLNDDVVAAARDQTFAQLRERLERGQGRVLTTIESLSDDELLTVGVFEWAGRYPIARLISINTSTQYASARTMIRRVLKAFDRF